MQILCNGCKQSKDSNEFYLNNRGIRRQVFSHWCKKCINKGEKERKLLYRYGITGKDYDILLEKQEGKCAICSLLYGKELHIDHCHKTNKVRGLLCNKCNVALGFFEDNIEILQNAIKYLQK